MEYKKTETSSNSLKGILDPEALSSEEQLLENEKKAVFFGEEPVAEPAAAETGRRELVEVPIWQFVERTMCWRDDRPMDFTFRPWLKRVYQSEHITPIVDGVRKRPKRRTLLKTGRQCEKSTSLGNKILAFSTIMRNVTCVFVSSALPNAKEFSSERIQNVLRVSPKLSSLLGEPIEDNVFTKRFANNSRLVIRATSDAKGADRVRGIAADIVCIDEIQDINPDDIPVITAATKNSEMPKGPIHLFAGTPKSPSNPIEQLWQKDSTQNTWMTRCNRCRRWNPPYPDTLGPKGMVCARCGTALNPLLGQWVSKRTRDLDDIPYEGYHTSRIIMPYTRLSSVEAFEDAWADFYADATSRTASIASIRNELFGQSYGSGRNPIDAETLMSMCHPDHRSQRYIPEVVRNDYTWPVFAGIDWGEGTGDGAYTVLSLGFLAEWNGEPVTHVHYIKRYEGPEAEPAFVKEDIARILTENNVDLTICDEGHGWGIMDYLWDTVPNGRDKIYTMSYSNQNTVLTFDENSRRFACNRTRWMAKVFSMMERQSFRFPNWEEFKEPYAQDILNISTDHSPTRKQMIYTHTGTDDTFHSLLYLHTARLFWYNELKEFVNA